MIELSGEEARLLARAIRPRFEALVEQRAVLVQGLPPGNDSWADVAEDLDITSRLLARLEGVR